jgi:iron complex outermembrane receptor protein
MVNMPRLRCAAALVVLLGTESALLAQRTAENAVTMADDAFGTSIGLESTGIYTDNDTRGFSPFKAGNVRFDGIYFDPIGIPAGRIRESSAIRVGFGAEGFPFQAPTGIVDYKFRSFPTKLGASISYNRWPFGGYFIENDLRIPVVKDRLSITGGPALTWLRFTDGSYMRRAGAAIRPIWRMDNGGEVSLFAGFGVFYRAVGHPLVVTTGAFLPAFPNKRRFLGQSWTKGRTRDDQHGFTIKTPLTDRLSMRGGLFYVVGDKKRGFSEIYSVLNPEGLSNHRVIADPTVDIRSLSGEMQFALKLGDAKWQHRIIAGFRGRYRITESGGSDIKDLGTATFGIPDREPRPVFTFGRPNRGELKQSAFELGYIGKLGDHGSLNLGLLKDRYRATSRAGRTGLITRSDSDSWLYSARAGINLSHHVSAYIGTQRGLEDSGTAPESAANRNEQLRATRSTQYEAGLRLKLDGGQQFVMSAFRISKPYFSFDPANVFAPVGTVRHRGVEASLSGHFLTPRLNIVAGAVALKPQVSGLARDLGLVGSRPTGTASITAKLDANYRTDIFGGLTPTLSMTYSSKRAVSARPFAALGGRQLSVPSALIVDLGARQRFKIGRTPASLRAVMFNVFDKETWKVVGPNTLFVDERRRLSLVLAVDI